MSKPSAHGKSSHGRTRNGPAPIRRRRSSPLRFVLTCATIAVWTSVFGIAGWKIRLSAVAGINVQLSTMPVQVRIQINSEPHAGGAHVTTPVTIKVPPGRSRLRIMRDGYTSQVVNVSGSAGESYTIDSLVLGRKPESVYRLWRVELASGFPAAIEVGADFGNGFATGVLPIEGDDLEATRSPVLVLSAKNSNGLTTQHRCRIPAAATRGNAGSGDDVPEATDVPTPSDDLSPMQGTILTPAAMEPLLVVVSFRNGRLRATNCAPIDSRRE